MFNAKILIVDEHRLVSSGIQALLLMSGFKYVDVVNTVNDGINEVTHHHVDIVILDPEFKHNNGIAFLRDIVKSKRYIKVILLSQSSNENLIMQSVLNGTNGFVSKHEHIQTLIAAISCVYNCVDYLPVELVKRKKDYLGEQHLLSKLTTREMLVLRQLAMGKSNKKIASELGLHNKTVSTYKSKIFKKLETKNLVEIIELARRNGTC